AGASEPPGDLLDGLPHRSPVRNPDLPPLASPIVPAAPGILVQCPSARHAVEYHRDPLTALLDPLPLTFVVTSQHAAEHDAVVPAGKGLGHISRRPAPAIRTDVTPQAVGGIGALDDRRQLGVAHTGHHASRAYAAGTDPDLDDVGGTRNQELLDHLRS